MRHSAGGFYEAFVLAGSIANKRGEKMEDVLLFGTLLFWTSLCGR